MHGILLLLVVLVLFLIWRLRQGIGSFGTCDNFEVALVGIKRAIGQNALSLGRPVARRAGSWFVLNDLQYTSLQSGSPSGDLGKNTITCW